MSKLVKTKTLQQGLVILISGFWQFRHSYFSWSKSNLKKIQTSSRKLTWKLNNIKNYLGVCFNEPVPVVKGGELFYIEWLQKNKQKENRLILCVYTVEKYEKV